MTLFWKQKISLSPSLLLSKCTKTVNNFQEKQIKNCLIIKEFQNKAVE